MNQDQQPNSEKKIPVTEIPDGRKDIYVSVKGADGNGTTMVVVTQEALKKFGVDYEEAKKQPELYAAILLEVGNSVFQRALPPGANMNFAAIIEVFPELVKLVDYFIDRCEGREPEPGHGYIRSHRAYKKFKDVQMKYFPSMDKLPKPEHGGSNENGVS